MEQLLLTPREAAERLAIGRSKLYELLADGALESVHIGSSRRIPVGALADFVNGLRTRAGSASRPDAQMEVRT